ncbi:hypothetical protein HV201_14535 [Citrobacter freundii]|uniref:ead/Ea22-like family protein n=1 Tax=Citrobacter freundii TaxID=546 RepID=UPI0015EAE26D|nr:ead/Ea22-like family protein [Citrobacter freundii]QLX05661.1 hypothetical protein HV201_14535 [Citrobacter freundii]
MTALNKYALREAAEKARTARARLEALADEDVVLFEDDDIKRDVSACNKFIVMANPDSVLMLLDELDAAELEARTVTLPDVEKWRSVDAVRAQNAYKVLVSKVLAAAGIGVKGE